MLLTYLKTSQKLICLTNLAASVYTNKGGLFAWKHMHHPSFAVAFLFKWFKLEQGTIKLTEFTKDL